MGSAWSGAWAGAVVADAITCIPDHEEALRYILDAASPGDLVVINTSLIDKVIALLEDLAAASSGRGPVSHQGADGGSQWRHRGPRGDRDTLRRPPDPRRRDVLHARTAVGIG